MGHFKMIQGILQQSNLFKGAHTVAVTATVSGKIKVYNSTGSVRYDCEFDNLQNYIDSGVFISAYYIEKQNGPSNRCTLAHADNHSDWM